MPLPILPDAIVPAVSRFERERRVFDRSPEGKALIEDLRAFATTRLRGAVDAITATDPSIASLADVRAEATFVWLNRMPVEVAQSVDSPTIDFDAMEPDKRSTILSASFAVLESGARALLAGTGQGEQLEADRLLKIAFGADPVSASLRRPFMPDNPVPLPDLPAKLDIDKLIRDGLFREVLQTFGRCGASARQRRHQHKELSPYGRIVGLDPSVACGGAKVTLEYVGFGTSAPDLSDRSRFTLALPVAGGETRFLDMDTLVPGFTSGTWHDNDTVTIVLPDDISSGCLDFYLMPPAREDSGCETGSLLAGIGMLQSILLDYGYGTLGIALSQSLLRDAILVENGPVFNPAGGCKAGDPNYLSAGRPLITSFRTLESGSVHPRGYVTLFWTVENADQVSIVAQLTPGSEHPHELPPITGPLPVSGTLRVDIPCTTRWAGRYVLKASNGNGCTRRPVEAGVALESNFSHYRVGVAKIDVTDPRPGLGLAGFADETQISTSVMDPLHARAFVIEENTAAANTRQRVAMVVADIWTCTQALKTAVVARLNRHYPSQRYTVANVLIAGTHTHAAPGGYSDYFLYNFSIGGFKQAVFDRLVSGISQAIIQADAALAAGRVLINAGDVADCGKNRSMNAYRNNQDVGADDSLAVNKEMQLLRFEHLLDSRGGTRLIGVLNWYAIHPTSLGYMNTRVSGDNKGWAATQFERALTDKDLSVVAAFANACAGDISGNIGTGVPVGSEQNLGALHADTIRMRALGQKQCDQALALYETATAEITGPLLSRYTHVDMSSIMIDNLPGARTWPAAIGVSFGAGSSEDSEPAVYLAGVKIIAKISEGISSAEFNRGSADFWLQGGPILVAMLSGLLVTVTLGPAAVIAAAPAIATSLGAVALLLAALPQTPGSSYLFATIGKLAFPGKVSNPPTDARGQWSWIAPDCLFFPPDYIAGHGNKAIMFPVGLWKLRLTSPDPNVATADFDCPLVPHTLPLQLLKIGSVTVAGVPAEFTTTAGRRLKAGLQAILGQNNTHTIISNYSNAYSGYVTTPEEYDIQEYEGASTLYGPHTLAAYQQEMNKLATALVNGSEIDSGQPFAVPAIV